MEQRYSVRQAAELTGVKPNVLRYWEEELSLYIGRNAQGHRCYTGYDIQLFLNIKELKKRGMTLRAIRDLIPRIARTVPGGPGSKIRLLNGTVCEEDGQEGKGDIQENESPETPGNPSVPAGKILEFQKILECLINRELKERKKEEERFRVLDSVIRRRQLARREAAAAAEKKPAGRFRRSLKT